jgi:hypothetical protein
MKKQLLRFAEHPNLCHHMSDAWMATMFNWLPGAVCELKTLLQQGSVEWVVTWIGAVGAELDLNGVTARLFLYFKDDYWIIHVEALHKIDGSELC